MNKWLARLEALEQPSFGSAAASQHCQSRQNGLLSVLAAASQPARLENAPALHPDRDLERFRARLDRLRRWGWPDDVAQVVAERLTLRDASGDDRVICAAECTHYRPGYCANHRRAGLNGAELGRDLAGLLQRCPGVEREG